MAGLQETGADVRDAAAREPERSFAGLFGACLELAASHRMTSRTGMVAEPYHCGRGGTYMKAGEILTILGAIGSLAGRRSRAAAALSGAALLAASAATRWGIFHAGLASANDPKYTVVPQRERLRRRSPATPAEARG